MNKCVRLKTSRNRDGQLYLATNLMQKKVREVHFQESPLSILSFDKFVDTPEMDGDINVIISFCSPNLGVTDKYIAMQNKYVAMPNAKNTIERDQVLRETSLDFNNVKP